MKKNIIQTLCTLASSFTEYSPWTTFQISLLSLLATGVFMVLSAEEMGAIGPILLSLGICLIFFVLVSEILLILRVLLKHLIIRLTRESQKSS
jgi:hypothetical protein